MTETLDQQPASGNVAATGEDTASMVFGAKIDGLAAAMPEHTPLLDEARGRAGQEADRLGQEVTARVDETASRFRLQLVDSEGRAYSTKPPSAEVDAAVGEIRGEHSLDPKGETVKKVEKVATQTITKDRKEKISKAEEQVAGLETSGKTAVSEEEKRAFAGETQEEYWRRSSGLLEKLEGIAGTEIATLRERGTILGGVAIGRRMGRLDKYMSANDRHEAFEGALRNLVQRGLPQTEQTVSSSVDTDRIRERFPQIDPASSFWREKVHAIAEKLDIDLAAKGYMAKLRKAASRIEAAKHRIKTRPGEPSAYGSAVIGEVEKDISRLRGEGLSDTDIYRQLAHRYHPDISGGGGDAERERFGYLSEWNNKREEA